MTVPGHPAPQGPDPGTVRLWLRPGLWGLHVFAIAAVCFCVWGGLWQAGAYDDRQDHERADRQRVPAVPLVDVWTPGDAFSGELDHRPVTVTGRFAPAAEQVWVSGREQDGVEGFWLLAPLLLDDDTAVLVVRGFSPEAGDLKAVPSGEVTGEVVLEPGEASGPPLTADRVIGTVRLPALVNDLPYDLFPGFGISTTDDLAGGLPLADPPEPGVSWTVGLKNLAYAFQWWVFALFAAFMWWRICADHVADARARATAPLLEKEPV